MRTVHAEGVACRKIPAGAEDIRPNLQDQEAVTGSGGRAGQVIRVRRLL